MVRAFVIVIACASCLANADSPLLDAARVGVIVMGTITAGVLAGFARWVFRLARLSSAAETEKS